MTPKTLLAALAVAGLALAGCVGLGPQIEPPEVFVVGLEPLQGGNFEQRFRIDLRVQNPNDFDLEINGLDFELDLNEIQVRGRLFLSNPPHGSVEFHRSGRMFR